MKHKGIFITALVLILVGAVVFGLGMYFSDGEDFWSFNRRDAKSEEITESFDGVSIDAESIGVTVKKSDDGKCKIEYAVGKNDDFSYSVNGGKLEITCDDGFEFISIRLFSRGDYVTLYLPEERFDALDVKTKSGSAVVEDVLFDRVEINTSSGSARVDGADVKTSLSVSTSSGSVRVKGLRGCENADVSLKASSGSITVTETEKCGNFSAKSTSGRVSIEDLRPASVTAGASSGSVKLENVVTDGQITVSTTSGGIRLEDCDGIFDIGASSGSVRCSVLSGKIYDLRATSGSIKAPESTAGAPVMKVRTTSGSITVTEK